MTILSTKHVPLLVVCTALLAAGGIALAVAPAAAQEQSEMDMEVTLTIGEDGESSAVQLTLGIGDDVYDVLIDEANQQGYDTAAEWFAADLVREEPAYVGYGETRDVRDSDGYELEVEFPNVNPAEGENTEIETEDDEVRVMMGDVDDPAQDPDLGELTYHIELPGPIEDSNAYAVDDGVATWELHEEHVNVISVEGSLDPDASLDDETESEEPSESDEGETDEAGDDGDGAGDDGDEADTDDSGTADDDGTAETADSDSLPGFGVGAAIVALLALLVARHD